MNDKEKVAKAAALIEAWMLDRRRMDAAYKAFEAEADAAFERDPAAAIAMMNAIEAAVEASDRLDLLTEQMEASAELMRGVGR